MSTPPPAKTITQVFEEFLADQKARISHKTFSKYRDIIDLFRHCLESYGPYPDPDAYNRIAKAGSTFCDTYGPEKIPEGFSEFLGYFMPRKVIAGNETMKAAGTVIKRLAKWLVAKGYVEDTEDEELVGTEARDLPASQKLLDLLQGYVDEHMPESYSREIEGHFWIQRVEPGRIWLEHMLPGDPEIGPIPVPQQASRICKVGWDLGGVVAKTAQGWRLLEIWNLSP